jgi:hypothetical protein
LLNSNTDNEVLVSRVYDVKEFMDKETEFYDQYFDRNRNLAQYIVSVRDIGNKYFPKSSINKPSTPGYVQQGQSPSIVDNKVGSKL